MSISPSRAQSAQIPSHAQKSADPRRRRFLLALGAGGAGAAAAATQALANPALPAVAAAGAGCNAGLSRNRTRARLLRDHADLGGCHAAHAQVGSAPRIRNHG